MNIARLCTLLLCCTLLLPACTANKQVPQTTLVNYYPACYQPINSLREAEGSTTKSAVVGGTTGALIGGLIGGLTSGSMSGALIGAGTGAVAGASIGYAKAKQDAIKDARTRYASYVGDIKAELGNLDTATMAAKAAQACYEKSFNELVNQYKAKTITPEEYRRRFNEIREGLQETAVYLGQTYAQTAEKEQQFHAALQDESSAVGKPVPAAKPRKASAPKSKPATKKVAAKQPQKSAPQPRAQALAGLDESTLDTMSEGTVEYNAAREDTQIQKVAIENQLLRMDNIDASLTSI